MKIAPNFTISDKDDTSIAVLLAQISTGLKIYNFSSRRFQLFNNYESKFSMGIYVL